MSGIERIVPGTPEWSAFYANHIFRYKWVAKYLEPVGEHIMDVACGVGYGTSFLAGVFQKVKFTGVDRNSGALKIASEQFQKPNIQFVQEDAEKLSSFQEKSVDSIVSVETFEHLPNPEAFLQRVKQLLVKGGRLFVSTPNGARVGDYDNQDWEFHEKEYTYTEAKELFEKHGFIIKFCHGQMLSETGKLADRVRKELNKLSSNPMVRLGRWIQSLKGTKVSTVMLPESEEDFCWQPVNGVEEQSFVLFFCLEVAS